MVDPDKEGRSAESQANGTEENCGAYRKRLSIIARSIWHGLSWPRRWWRGGDHQRRTANAAALLALGTVALAGVNLGMLIEMRRGTKAQHNDTVAALGRADNAVMATNRLADAARNQANAANATAEISRRSQRPYLFVEFDQGSTIVSMQQYPEWLKNSRFNTKYRIANHGTVPAIIERGRCALVSYQQLPDRAIIDSSLLRRRAEIDIAQYDVIDGLGNKAIESCGSSIAFPLDRVIHDYFKNSTEDSRRQEAHAGNIWLIGYIIYTDVFGVSYETTFVCNIKPLDSWRFEPRGGEGCNRRT